MGLLSGRRPTTSGVVANVVANVVAVSVILVPDLPFLLVPPMVRAHPTFAGSCNPGKEPWLQDMVGHSTNVQVGTGPLSDYGLEIAVDGQVLSPDEPFDFEYDKDHEITLTATENGFRGFLLRLDPGDSVAFTDLALDVPSDDGGGGGIQRFERCTELFTVSGLTHDNNDVKTLVTGMLNMEEIALGLILDVNVVVRNRFDSEMGKPVSEWYFSSYTLNSVENANTDANTPAPATPMPIPESSSVDTDMLTSGPTAAPAAVPSSSAASTDETLSTTGPVETLPPLTPVPTPSSGVPALPFRRELPLTLSAAAILFESLRFVLVA